MGGGASNKVNLTSDSNSGSARSVNITFKNSNKTTLVNIAQKTGLPSLGDYYLKDETWLAYNNYTSVHKPNIVGIYLGTNINNQKIIVSAGNVYQYSSYSWWYGVNIANTFYRLPNDLVAVNRNLAISSKLTGQQMSSMYDDYLESKDIPYGIKECTNYTFVDGLKTWYCPSPAEVTNLIQNKTIITSSLTKLGLKVNAFANYIATSMTANEQEYWVGAGVIRIYWV